MTYEKLLEFINQRMRMSHIYQPVMLMTLLKNKGSLFSKGDC
jgi:ATP adenylyltransferase